MYQKIILIVLLSCSYLLKAENISGTVLNAENQPLSNALVYIDGTTFGTNTDSKGYFFLNYDFVINPVLVVSELFHETVYISNLADKVDLKLNPKRKSELWETKLHPFTRTDAMNVFREQFLGISEAAKSVMFLNEEVIKFAYDKKQNVLVAFADERIKMKNDFLGYEVDFELIEFYAVFSKKSMKREAVSKSNFSGTAFYKELQDSEETQYERHRERVYYGTSKHFFRNFIQNKWGEFDFILFEGNSRVVFFDTFTMERFDDYFVVNINTKDQKGRGSELSKNSFKSFNTVYRNKKQSSIIFRTNSFKIDMFGNYSNQEEIDINGAMEKSLFGNFLPLNYILL